MNKVYTPWAWTYRVAFALLWFLIILFILRQVKLEFLEKFKKFYSISKVFKGGEIKLKIKQIQSNSVVS